MSRPDLARAGRRAAPVLALVCLPAIVILSGGPLMAQQGGAAAHIEGSVTGPIVETPEAMKVTTQILCFCGGCANQNLHDCTCGLAASERQKVAAALAAGQTPEALIAAYMAEHGAQIRVVPEKTGLNLIGWWVPFVAAAGALVSLVLVLRGWQRRTAEQAGQIVPVTAEGPREAERSYRDRLARELREFDR